MLAFSFKGEVKFSMTALGRPLHSFGTTRNCALISKGYSRILLNFGFFVQTHNNGRDIHYFTTNLLLGAATPSTDSPALHAPHATLFRVHVPPDSQL